MLGESALKEACRGLGRYQCCMSDVTNNLIEAFKTRPPTLRETPPQKKIDKMTAFYFSCGLSEIIITENNSEDRSVLPPMSHQVLMNLVQLGRSK